MLAAGVAATNEIREEVLLYGTAVVNCSGDTSRKTDNFDASAIYSIYIYALHIGDL